MYHNTALKSMEKFKRAIGHIAEWGITVSFLAILFLVFILKAPSKYYALLCAVRAGDYSEDYSVAFENDMNAAMPGQHFFVDINGLAHRLLFQREMNGVILLENGYESELMSNRSAEGIASNARSIQKLSKWLNDKGIRFFYCQVPMKNDADGEQIPAGLVDYSNSVADEFLKDLDALGVDYLDIRECIVNDGIDRYSLYLKTEHHWRPEGGFYAFEKICDYMRKELGEEIPQFVTDSVNYEKEVIKRGSLGYYGQRTGFLFAGLDDFTLMYPKWETKQSSWAPHKELLRKGTFYDAVFYTDYLNAPWRSRGLYGVYIGGDWPLVVHHSDTAPIDKTIMILIDSYGTIPEAFLTTVYKNIVALDLRWVLRTDMKKTTADFVEEYDPDIVIVMFNPNQIGYAESEQFQYGIE